MEINLWQQKTFQRLPGKEEQGGVGGRAYKWALGNFEAIDMLTTLMVKMALQVCT